MVTAFDTIPAEERIIVALDCMRDEAMELAECLRGRAKWVKIGMTLYYACGPSIIAAFKQRGFKVFLDLKLHDIPFQIEGAAKSAALTGADMLTTCSRKDAESQIEKAGIVIDCVEEYVMSRCSGKADGTV